ncbi:MAG: TetR/AcrR family transcriptional regulator [Thermodesulfobacteriota bacterium]|nr:TetR/AcrR family transcriptional regulator [Thermodesulfobacteriota bacterium]
MNHITPPTYTATQERILDTAEHLFAEHGIHATTLRTITGAAKVNLAAVNYHFGTKEQLIQAVLLRRLTPLNNERQRQLDTVLQTASAEKRTAHVDEMIRAFIEPTLHFAQQNDANKDFMSFTCTMMMNPNNEFRSLFTSIMEPLIDQLFAALQTALPTVPVAILHMRLQFTIGAMIFAMREIDIPISGQHKQLVGGSKTIINEMVSFISAGMEQS